MLLLNSFPQRLDYAHEPRKLSDVEKWSHGHCPKMRKHERSHRFTIHFEAHRLMHIQSGHHHGWLFCPNLGQ